MVLKSDCDFVALSPELPILDFDCGDADLNDFFKQDAIQYQNQLLGATYYFRHKKTGKVVCAFSLSPDGLNTSNFPGSRRKKVKELIPNVLNFYLKNDFFFVFSTEEQERAYYKRANIEPLRTRFMFYDMIQWKNKM
jgi:hypothetical protein